MALLQRVRETGDPSLYEAAETALDAARRLSPDDPRVLVGIGGLHLGRHEFDEALATGRDAVRLAPNLAAAHAVVVDALTNLGRYEEAEAAAGEMLGAGTDLTTLSRASYLAELRGDVDTAIAAMRLALEPPGLAPENRAFGASILGNLLRYSGEPAAARAAYEDALAVVPNHGPSLAGLGRLALGDGRLDEAIDYFRRASEVVPLPEYVIALGEAELAAGRAADAERSFQLAHAEMQLFEASGVGVDLELALFEAEHGDPMRALEMAESAYRDAPTIRAADAVAWALHQLGRDDEAARFSAEAVRRGSIDPLLHYHFGAIAAALGDTVAARAHLEQALAWDPGFSATGVVEARQLLSSLPGQ